MVDKIPSDTVLRSPSIPKAGESRQDKIFNIVNYTFLALCFISVMYPLLYVLSNSFSSPEAVMSGQVWLWPVKPSIEGYKLVFESKQVWFGYGNTLFYTFFGTMINVVLTIMVWNVIITRTYFQTAIPVELLEASQLDGCNNTRFIISVVIPLSGPILAAITLFYAMMHWNTFFNALIYLRNYKLYPLQIILRTILLQNQIDYSIVTDIEQEEACQMIAALLKFALIVVASLPVLVMYPLVQKYFVRGVRIGALKG